MLDLHKLPMYDGMYNVNFYYADPAAKTVQSAYHEPLPLVTTNAGLVNKGGYYDPIPSDLFWEQRAVGQVAKPTWIDYYNDHYALGVQDSFQPLRLKYGTESGIPTWVILIALAGLVGALIYILRK